MVFGVSLCVVCTHMRSSLLCFPMCIQWFVCLCFDLWQSIHLCAQVLVYRLACRFVHTTSKIHMHTYHIIIRLRMVVRKPISVLVCWFMKFGFETCTFVFNWACRILCINCVTLPARHLLIHSFISAVHPTFHSSIHEFTHWFVPSFIHDAFIHSIPSYIHSFMSFTNSFHSCVHSVPSSIHAFIHQLMSCMPFDHDMCCSIIDAFR